MKIAFGALALVLLSGCTSAPLPPPSTRTSRPPSIEFKVHPSVAACGSLLPVPASFNALPSKPITAHIRFKLSPAGSVSDVVVARSSTYPVFDDWAVASARTWKCPPSQRTADVVAEVPVSIHLD
jgi:TonB family protein